MLSYLSYWNVIKKDLKEKMNKNDGAKSPHLSSDHLLDRLEKGYRDAVVINIRRTTK